MLAPLPDACALPADAGGCFRPAAAAKARPRSNINFASVSPPTSPRASASTSIPAAANPLATLSRIAGSIAPIEAASIFGARLCSAP
jgi:hypothetical protein